MSHVDAATHGAAPPSPPATRRRGRSAALDAVRILAVLAVVVGHSRPEHTAVELTFTWHVPVFFVLSGYLLSPGRSTSEELRRRTTTILVPTFLWGVIVTVAWWIHGHHVGVPLDSDFFRRLAWGGSALGAPYSPFWFMPVLVAAVVLARMLGNVNRWAPWGVAVAGYLLCWQFPQQTATSFWSLMLAPACMIYVLIGQELRRWRRHVPMPFLVGAALLALAAIIVHSGTTWVNIKQGSFGDPGISAVDAAFISVGLVLVAESVFGPWSHDWTGSRIISKLAATSMPVILGHMLLLSWFPQPWGWPLIIAVIVVLWVIGLLLSLQPRAAKYLL